MRAFIEHTNKNRYINYPFAENISLVDNNGITLSNDIFIDAILYPLDYNNTPYLSKISNGTVYIGANGSEIASGSFDSSTHTITLKDSYNRVIGTLIINPEINGIGNYTFPDNQVYFAASCIVPVNYKCVRGLKLPDGSIMTGTITFKGKPNTRITAQKLSDYTVIIFDIIGEPRDETCLDLPEPIKCIKVEQAGGTTPLRISRSDNMIYLGVSYEQSDLCAGQREKRDYPKEDDKLPSEGWWCETGHPNIHYPPAAHTADTATCPANSQNYFITSITAGIGISPVEEDTEPVYKTNPDKTITELTTRKRQGIRISLTGLNQV